MRTDLTLFLFVLFLCGVERRDEHNMNIGTSRINELVLCEVWLCQVKLCLRHSEVLRQIRKVKLSVLPTPAGTSRCEASLHAPKVCLTCHKAHLVKKRKVHFVNLSFFGEPSGSRTPDTMIKSHVLYLLS